MMQMFYLDGPHRSSFVDGQSSREQNLMQQFLKQHVVEAETTMGISAAAVVNVICENPLTSVADHVTLAESLSMRVDGSPKSNCHDNVHGLPDLPTLTPSDLRHQQLQDPVIGRVVCQLETREKAIPTLRNEPTESPLL